MLKFSESYKRRVAEKLETFGVFGIAWGIINSVFYIIFSNRPLAPDWIKSIVGIGTVLTIPWIGLWLVLAGVWAIYTGYLKLDIPGASIIGWQYSKERPSTVTRLSGIVITLLGLFLLLFPLLLYFAH